MDKSVQEKAALGAFFALFLAAANAVPLGHYVDDVVWVLLAKSMAHGSLLASWSFYPRLETTTTWGLSFLLTPVALFGGGALAFKLACAAMLAGGLVLFYLGTRSAVPEPWRWAFLLALFFNGFTLAFSGSVLSEAAYLLVFGLLVYSSRERLDDKRALGLGLLTALLILTRAIGAAFALAFLIGLARSRRRQAPLFLAGCCAALPYFAASKLAGGSYTFHMRGWEVFSARAIASNAWFYLKGLSLLTFVYCPGVLPNWAWLKLVLTALVAGVAAYGARRPGPLHLYGALYLCVLLAWPYQAPRFVVPLYPVFLLSFLCGLGELVPRRRAALAATILTMLVALSNAGEAAKTLRDSLSGPVEVPHAAHLWLRDHAAPGDLVVSMDVARLNYFTGLRGVHFLPAGSAEEFAAQARARGARWFFIKDAAYVPAAAGVNDPLQAQYERLRSYLERDDLFELVHEEGNEGVKVYRPR